MHQRSILNLDTSFTRMPITLPSMERFFGMLEGLWIEKICTLGIGA